MKDEEKEIYERQVREANDVKAVINSKGWKDTVQPNIIMVRDEILLKIGRGESSEILTDREGRQHVVVKINPNDPYSAARAVWMVDGINAVLQRFDALITAGEQAKQLLKKSDTIVKL